MRILDAQIHVFSDDAAEYATSIGQTILPPEEIVRLMDEAGVAGAYLVPAGGSAANKNCLAAARRFPGRFRVMGRISLAKQDGRNLIADWANSGFAGVRMTFPPFRDPSWLEDGTADWFWPEVEKKSIAVMIWAPRKAQAIGRIAEKHPGLKIIIDHCNLYVDDTDETMRQEVSEVLPLARYPNVCIKASSLPAHSRDDYPYHDLHGVIRDVVAAFGAERVMWGTDLTRFASTYQQAIELFTKELDFLSEAEIEQIMGKTIARVVGW